MSLLNPKEIKNILEKHSVVIRKSWGQNFLISENILKKIIKTTSIKKSDVVVEVGPGIGGLTSALAQKARKVIAIEKDKKLIPVLKKYLYNYKNITLINNDILKTNVNEKKYKVVANVPYYITSLIIRKFLENNNPPSLLVLMVQKEVAQRAVAVAPKANLLGTSIQVYGKPEIVCSVSKSCFWPQPEVGSAVLKITPHKKRLPKNFYHYFFAIVKAGFSHPRKQLKKNFSLLKNKEKSALCLNPKCVIMATEKSAISLQRRPETLTVNEWKKITLSLISIL